MKLARITWVLAAACSLAACVTTTTGPTSSDNASPEDAVVYNVQLGVQYLQAGRRDLARQRLERALEIDPRSSSAHSAMALYWEQTGEVQRADESHRAAVRYGDDDPNIMNNYGTFLCRQGRYEESEEYFIAAASDRRYRTPEAAYTNAGICQRRAGELDRADELLRRALTIDPGFVDALWQLADLSQQRGESMSARAFLQRLEAQGTLSAAALYLGFRVETALGDGDAAQTYLRRLLRDFPDSEQARRAATEGQL